MEELKTVKQVFRDYNSNSFALSEAKVVCVNIYKKTNILEIKLKVASSILMKDLADFEKYLAKRFNFKDIMGYRNLRIENPDAHDWRITYPPERNDCVIWSLFFYLPPGTVAYLFIQFSIFRFFIRSKCFILSVTNVYPWVIAAQPISKLKACCVPHWSSFLKSLIPLMLWSALIFAPVSRDAILIRDASYRSR